MTKIKITTSQNIEIEYELATIFDRILAWLIDFLIIVVYAVVAISVVAIAVPSMVRGISAIALLPALFYHFAMEQLFRGQSVGKMAMRIKVVRLDGSPGNFGTYALRWVFRILEVNPAMFYGAFAIGSVAFTKYGQRLGDLIAGTTVIKVQRRVSLSETIIAMNKEGYQPLFPEVARLDDTDINTIREVLNLSRKEASPEVLNACANRVVHVLSVTPPANMNAEQFLRFVLKDYTQLHGG